MTAQGAETAMWTDIGGRENQQDRVAVFENHGAQLLVVADGLGGHEGGALAAQAVVDAARDHLDGSVRLQATEVCLAEVVADAHCRIGAIESPAGSSPHSTCVLLCIADGVATWAHVGDSRLYRFENGLLVDRTVDHSVVEMLRLRGRITEEEMKTHPDQNRLYEALGGAQTPKPDFDSKIIEAGDGFLLASDGIWEHVSNAQLEGAASAPDLSAALRDLVATAKSAGGPTCDNLAVVAWRFAPSAEPGPIAPGSQTERVV